MECSDLESSQSKKSALLILNIHEDNANYGFRDWNTCEVDNEIINVIHSLQDKSTDGTFGKFDHVIRENDWQCFLNQSNQTNSEGTVVSSSIRWEYTENGELCKGPGPDSILLSESFRSCEEVRSLFQCLKFTRKLIESSLFLLYKYRKMLKKKFMKQYGIPILLILINWS